MEGLGNPPRPAILLPGIQGLCVAASAGRGHTIIVVVNGFFHQCHPDAEYQILLKPNNKPVK